MTDTAKAIPVRNLYYLFCYAWNRFREASPTFSDVEDAPDVPHMLARALCSSVDAVIARGLDRAYLEAAEDLRQIRGKIDISGTAKLTATRRGTATCIISELSMDILSNQILKVTLEKLWHSVDLDLATRREIAGRLRWFEDISRVRIDGSSFRRALIHRNNAHYGLALGICELLYRCLIPTATAGAWRFQDIERDKRLMERVFQDFLRNFWKLEQANFRVSADRLSWRASAAEGSQLSLIPDLQTDVVLRSTSRVIIVDAKYYLDAFSRFFGTEKLHSNHLYQIYAYVKMLSLQQPGTVTGMLVYPKTSRGLDETYKIDGHEFRIRTVDLSMPWQAIHSRLLEIIK